MATAAFSASTASSAGTVAVTALNLSLRPKPKQLQQKHKNKLWKKAGDEPGPKWCSLHKTTNYSDSECFKQKATNDKAAGSINYANIGSAHIP